MHFIAYFNIFLSFPVFAFSLGYFEKILKFKFKTKSDYEFAVLKICI